MGNTKLDSELVGTGWWEGHTADSASRERGVAGRGIPGIRRDSLVGRLCVCTSKS